MKAMKALFYFGIGFVIGVAINLLVNYAANAADQDQLTEIVVTAFHEGPKLLQKLPASVTVVNVESEARLGSTDLTDVVGTIPSLSLEQGGPGLNKIDIRGITVENADILNNIDSRPLVAVYIDDTPIAMDGFNPDLKVSRRVKEDSLDTVKYEIEMLRYCRERVNCLKRAHAPEKERWLALEGIYEWGGRPSRAAAQILISRFTSVSGQLMQKLLQQVTGHGGPVSGGAADVIDRANFICQR